MYEWVRAYECGEDSRVSDLSRYERQMMAYEVIKVRRQLSKNTQLYTLLLVKGRIYVYI